MMFYRVRARQINCVSYETRAFLKNINEKVFINEIYS